MPRPLVETSWLAEHLEDPDLRIMDCSLMMEITDRGDRNYSSGRAAWDSAHIAGSAFVDLLTDLGPRYSPAVPLMCPLSDFAEAMESRGIGDDNQIVLYDRSNHVWAACVWWMLRVCGVDAANALKGNRAITYCGGGAADPKLPMEKDTPAASREP